MASAGTDYHSAAGTLTFAPGETTKQATVELLGDTDTEEPAREAFFLTFEPQDGLAVANAYVIPSGRAAAAARVIDLAAVTWEAGLLAALAMVLATLSSPQPAQASVNDNIKPGL